MPRKELNEATRDCTIHIAKRVHKVQFKRRAPRAIREIKLFAEKEMRTKVNTFDPGKRECSAKSFSHKEPLQCFYGFG